MASTCRTFTNFRGSIRVPERLDQVPTWGKLGAGEQEVLTLGIQIPGAVVILDERLGRACAAALHLN